MTDDLRYAMTEALETGDGPLTVEWVVARLLPVVEAHGRASAAAALRQAADKADTRAAHETEETADAFREVALYLRAEAPR